MSQMTCGQICDRQSLVVANHSTMTSAVISQMAQQRATAACILRRGKLVGIFTMKDLMVRVLGYPRQALWRMPKRRKMRDVAVRFVMTPDPVTVDSSTPVTSALRLMQEKRIRHLPVVKDGELYAMLTLRQVARAVAANEKNKAANIVDAIRGTWGAEEAMKLAPAIRAAARRR